MTWRRVREAAGRFHNYHPIKYHLYILKKHFNPHNCVCSTNRISGKAVALAGQLLDKKGEGRSRIDRDADTHQVMQLEEKDVVSSSVATVLSDLRGPGDWMPMEKLHVELLEQYSNVWHHSRVRRYLRSEDYSVPEAKGKPWFGLLVLLRKYPEHFVINTRSKGRLTL